MKTNDRMNPAKVQPCTGTFHMNLKKNGAVRRWKLKLWTVVGIVHNKSQRTSKCIVLSFKTFSGCGFNKFTRWEEFLLLDQLRRNQNIKLCSHSLFAFRVSICCCSSLEQALLLSFCMISNFKLLLFCPKLHFVILPSIDLSPLSSCESMWWQFRVFAFGDRKHRKQPQTTCLRVCLTVGGYPSLPGLLLQATALRYWLTMADLLDSLCMLVLRTQNASLKIKCTEYQHLCWLDSSHSDLSLHPVCAQS